ncbi:MAG: ThuA domain-containing protein [Verrucomicrobia bacterium]|nr:ThuA domain-containing protein [Verrucomicrobiota bacterium]MDA1005439.1 ThuA domain-containing protein [Verrucomicrobiota bacterium]
MKTNKLPSLTRATLLGALALLPFFVQPLAAQARNSTEAMGQKFVSPKPAETLRVLLVGSGSSHDFPKYFLGTDAATLKAVPGVDVAATPNLEEALALLPEADVLVFSGNHGQYGTPEFQKALNDFADKGRGLVFLHAATWNHSGWKGYNDRFINGMTPGHMAYGDVTVTVTDEKSPIMKGVPATFSFKEENYRSELTSKDKAHVLAENNPDAKNIAHPSVWTVQDDKARIVCVTLGHDAAAHDSKAYQTILINAVNWVAGR